MCKLSADILRNHSAVLQRSIFRSSLQEAFDIFGDVGDLLEIYDQRKKEEADGADEEQEPDFSDEEAAETFRVEQVLTCKPGQAGCNAGSKFLCILSVALKAIILYVSVVLLVATQARGYRQCSAQQVALATGRWGCVWQVQAAEPRLIHTLSAKDCLGQNTLGTQGVALHIPALERG